jgi:hypothetical protein
MRAFDPRPYLLNRGWNPKTVIECALCTNKFVAEDGFAFPGTRNGELVIAYMCSCECYLRHYPVQNLARAR